MSHSPSLPRLHDQLEHHVSCIYPEQDCPALIAKILGVFAGFQVTPQDHPNRLWDASDTLLITYGDSLKSPDRVPLRTLEHFLDTYTKGALSAIHVLPFCPFSSDDGFSVIDYLQVNPKLGDWADLEALSSKYRLMADLVLNHVSAESQWFANYLRGSGEGSDFFIESSPEVDLSEVVRPRSSPLLRSVDTSNGEKHVWCTFGHDQIDLNFSNPRVLLKFLRIIREYLTHGVTVFRLDAIAYLWKQPGTTCLHLPETHEVVRLIRTVLDYFAPGTLLITETNVPNRENLTYFGNRNEAHLIYNFSLAPLLVHALLSGTAKYLKMWMMSMPPAPIGCTYLNFIASHDGIGMRPAEGLLSEEEQQQLVDTIRSFGGLVSLRRLPDGTEKIYEINTSLFDAFQGTIEGPDQWQVERMLCSQTIMMSLEGIPAFYIHSLLATPGNLAGVRATGQNRTINRYPWDYDRLQQALQQPESNTARVLFELLRIIQVRQAQPAFHPNATQFTLQLRPHFFGIWRQSMDRQQSIFCVSNLSDRKRKLKLTDLNLFSTYAWHDLLTGRPLKDLHATITLKPYQTLWISNQHELP